MNKVMIGSTRILAFTFFLAAPGALFAADYPAPTEGDYVIRDFKFAFGEMLPELKVHYRTIGKAAKDKSGTVRNAVVITHGTTGNGAQFIRPEFAGELFGAGQPLATSTTSSHATTQRTATTARRANASSPSPTKS